MTATKRPKRRVREAKPIDWEDLRRRLAVANGRARPDLEGTWQAREAPEPNWTPEYVGALQRAIEGKDDDWLLELLDACAPLHPQLLRLIALRLRKPGGRPKKLTTGQESLLATIADLMTQGPGGEKLDAFVAEEAMNRRLSEATIRRAISSGRKINEARRAQTAS